MMLQRRGNLPAALADLDLAVRIAPEDPYIRRTRAHARVEAGELASAVEDFTRAIEVEPKFARQYLDRAEIYERAGTVCACRAGSSRGVPARLTS